MICYGFVIHFLSHNDGVTGILVEYNYCMRVSSSTTSIPPDDQTVDLVANLALHIHTCPVSDDHVETRHDEDCQHGISLRGHGRSKTRRLSLDDDVWSGGTSLKTWVCVLDTHTHSTALFVRRYA